MRSPRKAIPAWFQFGLGALLLVFLIASLLTRWEQVAAYDWQFRPGLLIASMLIAAGSFVFHGVLWTWIVQRLGAALPYSAGVRIYLYSLLAKYVPGGVWPLVTLTASSRQLQLSGTVFIVTYILDMLMIVWVSLIFAVPLLPTLLPDLPFRADLVALALLLSGVVWGAPVLRYALQRILHWRRVGDTVSVSRLTSFRMLAFLLATYCVFRAVMMLSFVLYIQALVDLPLSDAVSASVAWNAAWLLGFLVVIVPSGLGVREGTLVLLLTPLLTGPVATATAVAHRLVSTIVDLVLLVGLLLTTAPLGYVMKLRKGTSHIGPDIEH